MTRNRAIAARAAVFIGCLAGGARADEAPVDLRLESCSTAAVLGVTLVSLMVFAPPGSSRGPPKFHPGRFGLVAILGNLPLLWFAVSCGPDSGWEHWDWPTRWAAGHATAGLTALVAAGLRLRGRGARRRS